MSRITNALSKAEQDRMAIAAEGVPSSSSRNANGFESSTRSAESWEQAMEVVKRQLAQYEEQAARQAADQTRLKAQVAATEQLAAQVEAERRRLQGCVAESDQAVASIESTKGVWVRQLEALRECQMLSHAVRMTEEEFQAAALLAQRVRQSQQQVTQELQHHDQRREALAQQLSQLRFQLAKVLACTGTTDQTSDTSGSVQP